MCMFNLIHSDLYLNTTKKVQTFIIGEIVSQPDSKVTEDVAKSKLITNNTLLTGLVTFVSM